MAEGLSKGKADALLTILQARSLSVSHEVHARVLACTDTALLDTWFTHAATATSIADIFGE